MRKNLFAHPETGVIIRDDYTGRIFNRLTVLYPVKRKMITLWRCKCECGNEMEVGIHSLKRNLVVSCGCYKKELVIKRNVDGYKGIEDLTGNYISSVKYNANVRNLEFSITKEYIWDIFIKQNKKCALSGIDLIFTKKDRIKGNASLDRIDSSLGYIEGNLQWVDKDINKMKMAKSTEEFILMCKIITEYNNEKSS